MSRTTFQISGFREAERKLRNMERGAARRVVRNALNAGGRVLRDQAQRRVRIDSGETYFAIRLGGGRLTRHQREMTVRVFVDPKKLSDKGKGLYPAQLEYGTSKMGARPFMRPAWDQKRFQALRTIEERIAKGIEREAKKAALAGGAR